MKNILLSLILIVGWIVCPASTTCSGSEALANAETALLTSSASAPSTKASVAGDVQIAFEQTDDGTDTPGGFLSKNWGILSLSLLAFFDVVARLTPTTKDNSIVNLLTTVINAIIPNFKKGGGRF